MTCFPCAALEKEKKNKVVPFSFNSSAHTNTQRPLTCLGYPHQHSRWSQNQAVCVGEKKIILHAYENRRVVNVRPKHNMWHKLKKSFWIWFPLFVLSFWQMPHRGSVLNSKLIKKRDCIWAWQSLGHCTLHMTLTLFPTKSFQCCIYRINILQVSQAPYNAPLLHQEKTG